MRIDALEYAEKPSLAAQPDERAYFIEQVEIMRGTIINRREEKLRKQGIEPPKIKGPDNYTLIYDVPTDTGKRKQKWVKFFGTKREAENELARLIAEAASGNYVDPSKITVKELLEQYLDGNENRWEKKTYSGYQEKINSYMIPHIGSVAVEKLTASQIDKFLKSLQESGKKNGGGVSSQTAHHCRAILRAAINWALKKDIIKLNINPVKKSDPVKVISDEMQILNPEDCIKLVNACAGSIWEVPIILSLYTGMRQGECLGLHWSEVDFDNSTITVKQSLMYINGQMSLKQPKSKASNRTFEVTPEVIELLKKHKEIQELRRLEYGNVYGDNSLVCATESGGFMNRTAVTKGLQDIIKSAGIKRIRFHDLRHTHISISLANGESIIRVSKRVGHANPAITLKRYSHTIPGDMGAPHQFSEALKQAKKQPEK
jgi:integrase